MVGTIILVSVTMVVCFSGDNTDLHVHYKCNESSPLTGEESLTDTHFLLLLKLLPGQKKMKQEVHLVKR